MRAGVAVEVSSGKNEGKPTIEELHDRLKKRWGTTRKVELTPQDQQALHSPHITVQNKVNEDEAKSAYEEISKGWKNRSGKAIGFQL